MLGPEQLVEHHVAGGYVGRVGAEHDRAARGRGGWRRPRSCASVVRLPSAAGDERVAALRERRRRRGTRACAPCCRRPPRPVRSSRFTQSRPGSSPSAAPRRSIGCTGVGDTGLQRHGRSSMRDALAALLVACRRSAGTRRCSRRRPARLDRAWRAGDVVEGTDVGHPEARLQRRVVVGVEHAAVVAALGELVADRLRRSLRRPPSTTTRRRSAWRARREVGGGDRDGGGRRGGGPDRSSSSSSRTSVERDERRSRRRAPRSSSPRRQAEAAFGHRPNMASHSASEPGLNT